MQIVIAGVEQPAELIIVLAVDFLVPPVHAAHLAVKPLPPLEVARHAHDGDHSPVVAGVVDVNVRIAESLVVVPHLLDEVQGSPLDAVVAAEDAGLDD